MLRRVLRTGRLPRYDFVKEVTPQAAEQFVQVKGIGVIRGLKWAGRQHFTQRPGDLDLTTGRILSPTSKQLSRYRRELLVAHGVDAATWIVPGVYASLRRPDGTK